jgi:hypothetical protein
VLESHELNVPDALLAWGRDVSVCRSWAAPWAHEATQLVSAGQETPLSPRDSQRLLGLLEALAFEAVAAGRGDLLVELDTWTAAQLGLRFELEPAEGLPVVLGGEGMSYALAEQLLGLDPPPDAAALAFLARCQEFVQGAFPGARIDAMIRPEQQPSGCTGCGQACGAVSMAMESGSVYCARCYTAMTEDSPPIRTPKRPRKR